MHWFSVYALIFETFVDSGGTVYGVAEPRDGNIHILHVMFTFPNAQIRIYSGRFYGLLLVQSENLDTHALQETHKTKQSKSS